MRRVKRHEFIPENLRDLAYDDSPLPIGQGQTISQPYIVAYMTEMLNLKDSDRVLEIGTGSGYQAAVLAEIVREVYTVEIIKEFADQAEKRLKTLGYDNIHVLNTNGYHGWPENAPYDAIIVTASPPETPQTLFEQLKTGGRVIVPMSNNEDIVQNLYLITKTETGRRKENLLPVRFVPMVEE